MTTVRPLGRMNGCRSQNSRTFTLNQAHFSEKVAREDFGAGSWSVERRRLNGWEAAR